MSDKPNDISEKAAKIVWKNDKNDIQEFTINQENIASIGRDKDNNILLIDQKVSKHHATIQWKDGTFVLSDQGSSNGTYLNGSLTRDPTTLKHNDRIEISDYVIKFYILGTKSYETLMTRPLSELEETEDLPLEELLTQKLDESDGGAEKMITQAKESSADRPIAEQQEEKSEQQVEVPDAREPSYSEFEIETAEEIMENLDTILADLSKKLQAAQALSAKKNQMESSLKHSLEVSIGELKKVSVEMEGMESDAKKAELVELLSKLSKNATDVQLLMELANMSSLMEKLLRDYFSQAVVISKIKEDLEAALKDYDS